MKKQFHVFFCIEVNKKIKFAFRNKILHLILFLTFSVWSYAQQPVKEFIATNTNVAAMDNNYLDEIANWAKWIREYHSWAHYEAENNSYKWDNITTAPHTYTWPDHNKFMDQCKDLGIRVLIDALNKPGWAGSSPIPNTSGDGSSASDYMEKLEFLGQLVARYGSKTIDESLLESKDKATGLNYINYYEDENEPNYWWNSPLWPTEDYAKFCNAAHDGYGVQTNDEYPLLGIKSVDPDAKHVVAGIAGSDSAFFQTILDESNGRVPFDVLNIHHYCSDHKNGYSPEHETYGFETSFAPFFKWRNRVLPDMPVWLTEFGWDTFLSKANQHSYTYAPVEAQANYLMRSYFILMKMGFEKAFMFMAADVNSINTLQYSSSGVIKDKSNNYEKKPSYYYLTTMQNILGETHYLNTLAYAEESGNNEVYCVEFQHPQTHDKIYAVWTRETGSSNDNGATTNYTLSLEEIPTSVYTVTPVNLDEDGDTTSVTISGTSVELSLSETPIFVVASGLPVNLEQYVRVKPELNAYPNPSHGIVNLDLKLPENSYVNLSVYSANGQLVDIISDGIVTNGKMIYQFGQNLNQGIYYIRCYTKWGITVKRINIIK